MIEVDFITGLPTSNGFNSIATFTDRYTKRVHLAACKTTDTAEDFANMYIDVIVRHHGVVPLVLSDRDAKFTANFWRHLTARLGTTLKYATTDHHHTVGLVERANRTATEAIRTLTFSHPEDWSKYLAIVEYTINNTAHSTTRRTPFEHDYGYTVPRLDGFANEQTTVGNHIAEQKLNMHIMDDAMAAAREITANTAKKKTIMSMHPVDSGAMYHRLRLASATAPG
jgi:glycosylphosphatidylinositol phospholipase D